MEKSWDGLRRAAKSWEVVVTVETVTVETECGKMRTNSANRVEKM